MKDKVKYIFIGILLLGCFLLGKQCSDKQVEYKEIATIQHDTIWSDTTYINIPKPYSIHDTVYIVEEYEVPTDSIELKNIFKVRSYERSYKDGNIETKVYSNVLGYMLNQKIEYKDFKPISIINSTLISVIPQDTIKVPKKWEIRASIEATSKNAFVGLEYQKDRISYGASYDPFNKQVKAKLSFTIFRR